MGSTNTHAPWAVACLPLTIALAVAGPARAADLFLNDEPEVYAAVDKLNASGYLPGFLSNTRPYSIRAVRAAAEAASRAVPREGSDRELLMWLASYAAPKEMGRITAAATRADARAAPANNEGIPRPKGWAGLAAVSLREERSSNLSGQLRAASFYGEGGDDGNRLLDTSIEVGSRYASLQAGKLSAWYGPGRHGALIFSNNAAPYPGVRLHNPEPIPLTGWFRFLGNVQYDLFFARMDKKPLRSHSTLFGMRLAARPGTWLEVGVSRALHYGGEGASDSLSEFWTDFWGNNEPSSRSNSLVGFDLTLTLPFKFQPVQVYWAPAGEHSKPREWANQAGLYFPKVLGISRLDLRAEYADTFGWEARLINWYGSDNYPHRYRGDILGHAMGAYSRDLFFESRYFLLPILLPEVSFERVLHDGGPLAGERHSVYTAGLTGWLTKSWRGAARASVDRVTTQGGIPGSAGTDFSAFLSVAYQTSALQPPER